MPAQCESTYRPGGQPPVTLSCLRTDADESGRHRGRHHTWQDMPAGECAAHVPDPDRPGYSKWGTEPYDAWTRLWTWDQGGASGSSAHRHTEPTTCGSCGTPGYPESNLPSEAISYAGAPDAYAVAGEPDPQACYHCRLWAQRITDYSAGWQRRDHRQVRLIRLRRDDGTPSPRLTSWAEGITGAYGNRVYTVRWDDGDQRGPASSMWDCGAIPWWLDDHFPPNAVLVTP